MNVFLIIFSIASRILDYTDPTASPPSAYPVAATEQAPSTFIPGMPRQYGTIYSVSQYRLQLMDARSVLLSRYTVVDPQGAIFRRGQHILITGYYSPASKKNAPVIDARAIVVISDQ